MDPKNFKPNKLKVKTVEELEKDVIALKEELAALRVNQVASGVAAKLAKIKVVRKAIARTLTFINDSKRSAIKSAWSSKANLKKFNEEHNTNFTFNKKPRELKPKLTRALRRRLTKHQLNARRLKTIKKESNFPQRNFALAK